MKITINRVFARGQSLLVALDRPWGQSPESKRALRILYHHMNGMTDQSTQGRIIKFDRGGDVAAINTKAACQRSMDLLADKPIKITFGNIKVYETKQQTSLRNSRALRAVRNAGGQAWAEMSFTASLPVLIADLQVIEERTGCLGYRPPGRYHTATLIMNLIGRYADADPWREMKKIQRVVQRVVV